MSFTEIKTQEEFEERLKERLFQKEKSVRKEYENYLSPEKVEELKGGYQTQIDTLNDKVSQNNTMKEDYEKKIAKYESDSVKTRIAIELGIPLEFVERIKGTTEDEIREDAKLFSSFAQITPPLASTEQNKVSDEEYKSLLNSLNMED